MKRGMIYTAALRAHRAGLAVLPVRPDGSKAPAVPSWKEFTTRRPTAEEFRAMGFDRAEGLGIVAGNGVDAWDFDDDSTFDQFIQAAIDADLLPVVNRLRSGYEDVTPNGGRRWLVKSPKGTEWRDETLAARIVPAGKKTLIELPTFVVVAPSNGRAHPSGKAYQRASGDSTRLRRTPLLNAKR